MRWSLAICFLIFLFSCQKDHTSEKLNAYFDLETLFHDEIGRLKILNPTVTKSVGLGLESEESKSKIDTGAWENEFAVFIESNINKSALVGAFEKIQTDTSLLYQRKDLDADGVKSFKILYFENSGTLGSIQIETSTANSLYQSERTLYLVFQRNGNHPAISSYAIEGSQTIIFQDPTYYNVEAEFVYD